MPVDWVLDASVAGALFFHEAQSDAARALVDSSARLIAPDLIFVELASIGAKKVRRTGASAEVAQHALAVLGDILSETAPAAPLAGRALALAADHGFSAYDGLYLALAEARGVPLVTADMKLYRRAVEAKLAHLVTPLDEPAF